MNNRKLLVLYLHDNGTQHWAIYSGLEKEADEEKILMYKDGFIEVGRILVEESINYSKVIK